MYGDTIRFNLYADGTKIEIDEVLDYDVVEALYDAIEDHFGKYAPNTVENYQVELTDGFLVDYTASKRVGYFRLPALKTMIDGKEYTVQFHGHEGNGASPKPAPKKRTATRKAAGPKTCPEGKILNPKTGRCVSATSRTGKATGPKTCPEGKILNPKTGRCVAAKKAAAKTRKLRRQN